MTGQRTRWAQGVRGRGLVRAFAALPLVVACTLATVSVPAPARATTSAVWIATPATSSASSAPVAPIGGRYNPVPPRVVRARNGQPAPGRVLAHSARRLVLPGGSGVPPTGVQAVMLAVSVSRATSNGAVTVAAPGAAGAAAPRVLVRRGVTTTNQVLAALDDTGTVMVRSSVTATVTLTVLGWVGHTMSGPGRIAPITARRVIDTRRGVGTRAKPVRARHPRVLRLRQAPPQATAVIANVTVYRPSAGGYLEIQPAGRRFSGRPAISLSRKVSETHQVMVPLGPHDRIALRLLSGRAHVTVDIQGWVTATPAGADSIGSGLTVLAAARRVLDTREHMQGVRRRSNALLQVAGTHRIPGNVTAVLATLTVVAGPKPEQDVLGQGAGLLPGVTLPAASPREQTTSATVLLPLGPRGRLRVGRGVRGLVVDVTGWVRPQAMPGRAPGLDALVPLPSPPAVTQTGEAILHDAVRYLEGSWWRTVRPTLLGRTLEPASKLAENSRAFTRSVRDDPSADSVRRLSMAAFAIATALRTGVWSDDIDDVSADVVSLITAVVGDHVTSHERGWGSGSQGSLWAAYLGRAAWLMWSDLTPATRAAVQRMITFEADEAAGTPVLYLRDRQGRFLRDEGNSGAEEVSWQAMPVQLAIAMFPTSDHVRIWQFVTVRNALAAWATPGDVLRSTAIQGRPLSAWLGGSNLEGGALEGVMMNHNRIAPDYMALIYQTLDQVWVQALIGQSAPEAARALLRPVYDALTGLSFDTAESIAPRGAVDAPGGTMYQADSPDIYYPQGVDWGAGQKLVYALADLEVAAFGVDPDAQAWADLHLDAARAMQQRYSDGHTYAGSDELNYVGREELLGQLAAQVVLTRRVADGGLASFTSAPYDRLTP